MKKFFLIFAFLLVPRIWLFCGDIFTEKEAIIFGITQGITEYLPISSTGHMILVDKILADRSGGKKLETNGALAELRACAKGSYFCMLQVGSLLAVLLLYRRRFVDMALGLFGHNGHGRKLILRLVISAAPAALVGFFVDGIVQKTLYNASVVAIALAVGGVIILLVEASYVKKSPRNFAKRYCTIESLSVGQSLTIGMWQCLALIPGISRSMATIVSGYWCGLRRAEAAEYSFLLGAVVSSAAVAYKLAKDFDVLWLCIGAKTFLLGTAVAFIASAIAIKAFVAFISHYGIVLFGYYRIFLALFVFLLLP